MLLTCTFPAILLFALALSASGSAPSVPAVQEGRNVVLLNKGRINLKPTASKFEIFFPRLQECQFSLNLCLDSPNYGTAGQCPPATWPFDFEFFNGDLLVRFVEKNSRKVTEKKCPAYVLANTFLQVTISTDFLLAGCVSDSSKFAIRNGMVPVFIESLPGCPVQFLDTQIIANNVTLDDVAEAGIQFSWWWPVVAAVPVVIVIVGVGVYCVFRRRSNSNSNQQRSRCPKSKKKQPEPEAPRLVMVMPPRSDVMQDPAEVDLAPFLDTAVDCLLRLNFLPQHPLDKKPYTEVERTRRQGCLVLREHIEKVRHPSDPKELCLYTGTVGEALKTVNILNGLAYSVLVQAGVTVDDQDQILDYPQKARGLLLDPRIATHILLFSYVTEFEHLLPTEAVPSAESENMLLEYSVQLLAAIAYSSKFKSWYRKKALARLRRLAARIRVSYSARRLLSLPYPLYLIPAAYVKDPRYFCDPSLITSDDD